MHKLLSALFLLAPGFAVAADKVLPAPAVGDVALSLLGIVILILLLAWGLRRMRVLGPAGGGRGIRVVTALAVGARERIVVVQVGEKQLVVGMGPGHMQTLHVLDKPLDSQLTAPTTGTGSGNFTGVFASKLRDAMAGRGR